MYFEQQVRKIMNCPKCKTPMIVLELKSIEIDHCTTCSGIWLDSGELELFAENMAMDSLFFPVEPEKLNRQKAVRCPLCIKKMAKVSCGQAETVIIDKCKNSHGYWFDKGELGNLLDGCRVKNNVLNMLDDMLTFNLRKERRKI
jgi:Zn-finger nucleic acid-binding protein